MSSRFKDVQLLCYLLTVQWHPFHLAVPTPDAMDSWMKLIKKFTFSETQSVEKPPLPNKSRSATTTATPATPVQAIPPRPSTAKPPVGQRVLRSHECN